MSLQDQFNENFRKIQEATTATEAWTQSAQKGTDLPTFPADPAAALKQWTDFTKQLAEVNAEYVANLTRVANEFGGAVRQHLEGVGEAMRGQARAVAESVQEQASTVVEAERERVEAVEHEQARQARAARNAERQKARQERQAAAERYDGWTKAQLVEELSSRDLPKSGNVDDLIERLVDVDTDGN